MSMTCTYFHPIFKHDFARISPEKNPEAGVNDLALQPLHGRVAALTAGDDHALGLCLYALEDGETHGRKMAATRFGLPKKDGNFSENSQ